MKPLPMFPFLLGTLRKYTEVIIGGLKAGLQVGRKRKRMRRSHVERKPKQNEIRTRISVFQAVWRRSCSQSPRYLRPAVGKRGFWELRIKDEKFEL